MDQIHHPSLAADPVAKLPYINKPLLFLTVRDVLLALVEEENRPGEEEVMSRSKCQKKRFLGSSFQIWGMWNVGHAAGGSSLGVHRPCIWSPICLSGTNSWDALNKK